MFYKAKYATISHTPSNKRDFFFYFLGLVPHELRYELKVGSFTSVFQLYYNYKGYWLEYGMDVIV